MSRIAANGTMLEVLDRGQGRAVVFIHGMMCSGRFFARQVESLTDGFRAIVPDLRGHGESDKLSSGHTVGAYAQDMHALFATLGIERPVVVGWSMGSMIAYEYLKRYGGTSLAGLVIVDQPPSDFAWPDYEFGFFTPEILDQTLEELQTNPDALIDMFVDLMLHEPAADDGEWMRAELQKVPGAIAATILVSQTLKDYRAFLPEIQVPTLVAFGTDPKLSSPEAGAYIAQRIPRAKLELFEASSHAPFWEEPDRFNAVLEDFLAGLNWVFPPAGSRHQIGKATTTSR